LANRQGLRFAFVDLCEFAFVAQVNILPASGRRYQIFSARRAKPWAPTILGVTCRASAFGLRPVVGVVLLVERHAIRV
jgi:hypothetical protein